VSGARYASVSSREAACQRYLPSPLPFEGIAVIKIRFETAGAGAQVNHIPNSSDT